MRQYEQNKATKLDILFCASSSGRPQPKHQKNQSCRYIDFFGGGSRLEDEAAADQNSKGQLVTPKLMTPRHWIPTMLYNHRQLKHRKASGHQRCRFAERYFGV